jgi:hypothetical protein
METSHSLGKALSMEGRDIRLTQQVGFTDSVLGQVSTGSRSRPSPDVESSESAVTGTLRLG